jgi:uncharacterized membrane protein
VERVERSVEVDRPIRAVYDQWTQFEQFPRFMSGVKEVTQLDDAHVQWHADIGGRDTQWDAEITEQILDERISWRSTSGDDNACTVRFEPLPGNRTLVRLVMGYEASGRADHRSDTLGLITSHIENTMQDFKSYIERRQ